MQYRALGQTGINASMIGLGCEHLDGRSFDQINLTVNAALDAGVNILDVFMPGHEVRQNIARALGSRRKEVYIQGHIGSTDLNQQYDISRDLKTIKRYFEDILRLFGGHIDLGMMFFIDSEKHFHEVFDTEFAAYVMKLKADGDIGHIGFSSHNPKIAAKVIETGLPEMLLFSINPAFDMLPPEQNALDLIDKGMGASLLHGIDPERAALYSLCMKKKVGITVMKTLGAGKLLSKEHTPFERPLTVHQCIHYALSRPAVASVLLGCKTPEEIQDAVTYFDLSDQERDYSEALGAMRNNFRGRCVYCGHCQPCPVEIDIAAVHKYLDIANLDTDHIPPSILSHYRELSHPASECIACGHCESRCPFGVPVIQNMGKASALLEV